MKKIILCIALLLGFSTFLISNSTEAQASANSELKSIKKYAAKGTVKGAKGIKLGSKSTDIKKKLGKPKELSYYKYMFQSEYKTKYGLITFLGLYDKFTYLGPKLESKNKVKGICKKINGAGYSYSQIKKVFGKPYSKGYNHGKTAYEIRFKVNGKKITFSIGDEKTYRNYYVGDAPY
ncbi:hypothetical protein [Kurthia gibsonii]|uniref:hypothetical protein n=1 Tax=Kurthia gibsonii TaxID=33946 RepID=UPI002DBE6119|nr:hypothetical protein [Kurthia gibsonii]MEB7771430.1 hypothetical protein [Kurthia gibsonii]